MAATQAYIKIHALTNLQFLCRLCACNIKNRIDESLSLAGNPALKETCEKFLHIKLDSDDLLPKLICKACYRTIASAEALANVAKQTQRVFGEYFEKTNEEEAENNSSLTHDVSLSHEQEYTPLELNLSKKNYKRYAIPTAPPPSRVEVPPTSVQSHQPRSVSPQPPQTPPTRKAEVVVNVSVNDPLTRDNQQKLINHTQRRQSLLVDSRYTPKSIAQKSMTALAAHQQPKEAHSTKKQSPPGVINFFPNIGGKHQQKHGGLRGEGGYMRLASGSEQEDTRRTKTPSPHRSNAVHTPQQVPVDYAQHKRRNFHKSLNNVKSCTGQISLLKVSQNKTNDKASPPTHEVVNQTSEESLPDEIIIAAPKDKVKKSVKNSNKKMDGMPPVQDALTSNQPPLSSIFPEDIPLGRVIKDVDLLKLILRALKWPVTNVTFELQMNRLRTSKFTDIMSDPNLLQDTDIVQLLHPYLAPVLLAAQALQQQQLLKAVQTQSFVQPSAGAKPIDISALDINSSLPYKLPPETSVQLVPAQPNHEQNENKHKQLQQDIASSSSNTSLKRERKSLLVETKALQRYEPLKRLRRAAAQKARDSIIISDEDDDDTYEKPRKPQSYLKHRSSKSSPNVRAGLIPAYFNQYTFLNASVDSNNEALMALLQRQKAALNRQQRAQRRRHSSNSNTLTLPSNEFDALLDLGDDIVLMDQETNNASTAVLTNTNANIDIIYHHKHEMINKKLGSNFTPVITRPIIKRRKTVIQSAPRNKVETEATPLNVMAPPPTPKHKPQMEEEATQVPSNLINAATQISANLIEVAKGPSKSTSTEVLVKACAATSVCSLVSNAEATTITSKSRKQLNTKATLGQQLLEAIGLQKVNNNPKTILNMPTEAVTTSSTASPQKDSVQQIRSALKRSLKHAQEQQQQRKQELCTTLITTTIIQDADSTTPRSMVKEVIIEGKQRNSGSINSMVDLEDQIDKVTLVRKSVEQNTKTAKEAPKKDTKITITETKVNKQGRGRPSLASQQVNMKQEEKQLNSTLEDVSETKFSEPENQKESLENDTYNISSSSVPLSLGDSVTSTNLIPIKQEITTPRRRGRKRNVDKGLEAAVSYTVRDEAEKMKLKESEASNKTDDDNSSAATNSGRPTRYSKTLSKYYKGPEKINPGRRNLPTRSTRNR